MKHNTIINVQFLRAFAALAVVLFHASAHFFAMDGASSGNIFSFFSLFGYAGVDVFFVISGYIIWVSTKHIEGTKGVFGYIYNRVSRIYLGYWPYFFLLLLLAYNFAPKFLENIDLLGSFFLTESYLSKLLLKVSWTLKYELYFYLCFAFLLLVSKKHRFKLLLLVFFVIIGVQSWGMFVEKIYLSDNIQNATWMYTFYLSPFCLEFLLGCFVGYYFEQYRVKNLIPIAIVGIGCFFWALYYQDGLALGKLTQLYYINQRVLLFGLVSISLLITLIEIEKRNIVLLPKISKLLGGASYSLYLSHTIILYFFYHFGIRDYLKQIGSYQVLMMLAMVLIIVGYSVVHYLWIEQPLMKWSKKLKTKLITQ